MSLLSPRFFALPLIALSIIASLPREADTAVRPAAVPQTAVARPMSCAPAAPTPCIVAASTHTMMR